MKLPTLLTILPLLLVSLAGCKPASQPRAIDRLDLALAEPAAPLSADRAEAFADWAEIIEFGGSRTDYAAMPAVRAFEPLVRASLPPLDSLEAELGRALASRPQVRLYGVVSPFSQAVVTHPDGRVFIALNHYLGPQSEAYAGFPEFLRRRKQPRRLPADVVEAVIAAEVDSLPGPTLVCNLLYRGALLDETSRLMPEMPDSVLLAMTPEELQWCVSNEERIWNRLIEGKMLYSADSDVVARLMRPAPAASMINANAPGSAALFIALQIARCYRKHNPDRPLLENGRFNDPQSLINSHYTPPTHARS